MIMLGPWAMPVIMIKFYAAAAAAGGTSGVLPWPRRHAFKSRPRRWTRSLRTLGPGDHNRDRRT